MSASLRSPRSLSVLPSLSLLLLACGRSVEPAADVDAGPSSEDARVLDAPPRDPTRDWALLERYLDETIAAGTIHGYAIQVFDHDDRLLFERADGACTHDSFCPTGAPPFTVELPTAIASSTKWVSSTTILATLEAAVAAGTFGSLDEALDARIDRFLSCPGGVPAPYDASTLRQLLSFTSGVAADHNCVGRGMYGGVPQTLETCACTILADSAASLVLDPSGGTLTDGHPPGTTYKYGASHLTIAGAVAENIDGRAWHDIFEARVRVPAGLSLDYRAMHENPSLAGSIWSSAADYARFVRALFHDARDASHVLLSAEAALEQRAPQVGPDVVLRNAPQPDHVYGLNTWRLCTAWPTLGELEADVRPPAMPDCTELFQTGHGGKGGYAPFIDVSNDAYGVFAMREDSAGGGDDYSDTQLVTEHVRLLVALIVSRRTAP